MFGLSITKLLFTAAAIFIVWWGFKWVGRMQDQRGKKNTANGRRHRRTNNVENSAHAPATPAQTEDMVACKSCGTYVTASGAKSCGRGDCPYPG